MRALISLLLLSLITASPAFAQKKKKGAETVPVEAPKPVEGAPDPKCGEAPFSMESPEIYSVFTESAKTKDFETALLYGPWLACAHPKKMAGLPSYSGNKMFERLADVYEGLALKQKAPKERSQYLDSAAWAYGRILEVFTASEVDQFDVRLNRGRFFQKNADYIDNAGTKAFEDYVAMYNIDKKRAVELADGYYVQVILANMVAESKKDEALAIIADSEPLASAALKDYFNQVRDRLFSNPEERAVFLQDKLKTNPKDQVVLNELYDVLNRLKRNDEARKIAEELYKLDPSFVNTIRVADNFESKGDYKSAIRMYNEALGKVPSDAERKEVFLKMAENYVNTSDLKTAREFARKALALDSKSAKALLEMAKIYNQAVSQCGGTIERPDKVLYWLAMDYAERAKAADPSTANYAEQQIRAFKNAAPNGEDVFFMQWKPGQRIKVDKSLKACYDWVNEETTVR